MHLGTWGRLPAIFKNHAMSRKANSSKGFMPWHGYCRGRTQRPHPKPMTSKLLPETSSSFRSVKPHRQHSKTTLTASRSPDASHWMRRLTLPPAGGLANATTASPSVSRPSLGRHVPCPLHRCSSPSPRHGAQKCPLFPALLLDNI